MTTLLPARIRVRIPPVKSQGIKTKLLPLISSSVRWQGDGCWIEPFLGSGVVLFNIAPKYAFCADSNRHIIELYRAIQSRALRARDVRLFLESEGAQLLARGEDHYYFVRERFNTSHDPLDFLFLNRACFNGMIRFNSTGRFNVPFCRKPDRFRPAYITKICNQVEWLEQLLPGRDWQFELADWRDTLARANPGDFVYVDPPYIGRHTDYYNSWSEPEADELAQTLKELPCGFAYSMWFKNQYRENQHLARWFSGYSVRTFSHYYHVGPTEDLRNEMEEALVVHPDYATDGGFEPPAKVAAAQMALL